MKTKDFYSELLGSLAKRKDIIVKKYRIKYPSAEYDFLKIFSGERKFDDKLITIRAGIHGNEVSGPLTILSSCNEIIDYIHRAGLKCIIYPLGNPAGFDRGTRYHYKVSEGNNDFIRYELEDGKIVGVLGEGAKYKRWYWSSDPKLKIRLPRETRLMHGILKHSPLSQNSAVIDLHQDCSENGGTFGPAAYHYAFGDLSRYQSIVQNIEKTVPILRDTVVEAGQHFPEKTDMQGFIVTHDGVLTDLFFRWGVKHCITAETTIATPLDLACKVNLIWIFGIVDLVKEEIQ